LNSLGAILRETKETCKASLTDLTVLSPQNDPFRLDTPANHTKGRWFREHMEACGLFRTAGKIHNRGIHYAMVSLGNAVLPDGSAYVNDADCWAFLEEASNTARWLGYVAWDKIIDARNAEPVIRVYEEVADSLYSSFGGDHLDLPSLDDLSQPPRIGWSGFEPKQPYRLVFFGEKTSLGSVLGGIAYDCQADLYLPSGEISNTLLATMAKTGAEDGREMIVLVFADCDPAGYQMGVSIGHKLRALAEGLYPDLRFRVLVPALTVDQVREHNLPSTPLKESEKRASGWRERYGVDQTEIDALATLRPALLRSIVRDAIAPFYDASLRRRSLEALQAAVATAQEEFDQLVAASPVPTLQSELVAHVEALKQQIEDKQRQLRIALDAIDVTVRQEHVEPELAEPTIAPLVTSDMPLVEHIRILKTRKDYSGGSF
jgi:hypothetical protein